jgi:hypothetical protein
VDQAILPTPASDTPSVSVIIPTYNRAGYLAEAVESVLAQSFPAREIIVVDDGSKDNTAEVAASFGDRIIYHRQDNAERGAARNKGFQLSHGSMVAFLDSDDLWMPDKLKCDVDLLMRSPEVGLVYSDYLVVDSDGRTLGHVNPRPVDCAATSFLMSESLVSLGTHLIRRECVEATGGFREERELSGNEDWEFWVRLSMVTRFRHNPVRTAKIRSHDANTMNDAQVMGRAGVAALTCFRKMVLQGALSPADYRRAKGQVELVSAINFCSAHEAGRAARLLVSAVLTRPRLLMDLRVPYTAFRILRSLPAALAN